MINHKELERRLDDALEKETPESIKKWINDLNIKDRNTMTKEINFRIIELPNYQVLLTKDFDEENDSSPVITATVFLEGVKLVVTFGYHSEESRNNAFEAYAEEKAQNFVDKMTEQFIDD